MGQVFPAESVERLAKTMLKTFARLALAAFLVAVPFLFYGFGAQAVRAAAEFSLRDARWLYFTAGALVFLPCYLIAKRLFPGVWNYLETFEHEMSHLLIGLLFLKLPWSLVPLAAALIGGGWIATRPEE